MFTSRGPATKRRVENIVGLSQWATLVDDRQQHVTKTDVPLGDLVTGHSFMRE